MEFDTYLGRKRGLLVLSNPMKALLNFAGKAQGNAKLVRKETNGLKLGQ